MGENLLVRQACEMDRKKIHQAGSWSQGTRWILEEYGLEEAWQEQDTGGTWKEWADKVDAAVEAKDAKQWKEECERKVKLEGYRNVKTERGTARYLTAHDQMGRCLMARLRGGTNWLRIEQGRYVGEDREERTCRVCGQGIEDERHFLGVCTGYSTLRKEAEEELRGKMDWKDGVDREDQWEEVFRGGGGNIGMIEVVMRYIKGAVAHRERVLGTNVYKEIRRYELFSR